MEGETRYKEWMEKVTQNAVDKALQFCTISQSTNGLHTGSADVGPVSQHFTVVSFNGSPICGRNYGQLKNWSLDKNSTDRSNIAASIYNLLLQWNPDVSGQWASKSAAAVPILEEALYQKASNLEDYKNTALLDVHLRQVLRQFERGNGQVFFSQQPLETCLTRGRLDEEGRVAKPKSVRTRYFAKSKTEDFGKIKQIRGQIVTDDQKTADEEVLQCYLESTVPKEDRHPVRDKPEVTAREADIALWDAIFSGNLKSMEENLTKFQNSASKKLVKRVAGLISLKKQDKAVSNKEHTGMGGSVREKITKFSVRCQEASEEVNVFRQDLQHVTNERSTIAEKNNGLKKDRLHGRPTAFVDLGVNSHQSLSAKENTYSSREDLPTCPRSMRFPMHVNQNIDSSKTAAESEINPEVTKYIDCPQVQPLLKPSAISLDTSDDFSTCSVLPLKSDEDCIDSALSKSAEIDMLCLPLESVSNQNNLRDVKRSQHRDYRELISLRYLFKLDDDEVNIPNVQGNFSGSNSALIESPNAQRRNTEQVAYNEGATVTGDEVLRMRTDSIRVSLLSLLTESHHTDNRVSLMSLLRERNDYEVVIFDQDILASINSDLSHSEDDCEPLELHAICCVCMVGQRGAAFVPCGHTFCRKCACELQMCRGACPLCNRSIKQILKLY